MGMFDYLERFVLDADHKAIYVLTLICIAMVIDFLSGTIAAKINPDIEFKSKVGINGILRKVSSIVLLLFFVPLAPLVPGGAGVGLVYVLYIGYLLMEIKSILENYKKMGIGTELFESFIDKLRNRGDSDD
jgi:toxin secretion/phage lysis holin